MVYELMLSTVVEQGLVVLGHQLIHQFISAIILAQGWPTRPFRPDHKTHLLTGVALRSDTPDWYLRVPRAPCVLYGSYYAT